MVDQGDEIQRYTKGREADYSKSGVAEDLAVNADEIAENVNEHDEYNFG